MKFIEKYEGGKPVYVTVYWRDHNDGCEKCRTVELDKSATFANACVTGSKLLMEEMVKRQAPVVKERAAKVREWAKKAGVFKDA